LEFILIQDSHVSLRVYENIKDQISTCDTRAFDLNWCVDVALPSFDPITGIQIFLDVEPFIEWEALANLIALIDDEIVDFKSSGGSGSNHEHLVVTTFQTC
jgi:hypothetical protein